MADLAPAIQKLLMGAHGGGMVGDLAAYELELVAELVVQCGVVVTNHIQTAALQRTFGTEGGHHHMPTGLDGSFDQIDVMRAG